MAIKYEEVNQLALSKASRSAAIADCVVVRTEMLVAVRMLDFADIVSSKKRMELCSGQEKTHDDVSRVSTPANTRVSMNLGRGSSMYLARR